MDDDKNEEEEFDVEEALKNENLDERAQYKEVDETKTEVIRIIRWMFSEMYKCMDNMLEKNRESSLAYTKMEEAQMWAIKSITHNDYPKTMDEIRMYKE